MEEKVTLSSLFNSRKDELEQKLSGLQLPSDAEKVQKVIADYLKGLFDNEGEFRQSLTQSEDYILQAALSLLSAQQEMSNAILKQPVKFETKELPKVDSSTIQHSVSVSSGLLDTKIAPTHALLGSGGGALVGNLVFGGWGAVFGAIAGTAVTVYLSNRKESQNNSSTNVDSEPNLQESVIDTKVFITIIAKICDSVDNLISTLGVKLIALSGDMKINPNPLWRKSIVLYWKIFRH